MNREDQPLIRAAFPPGSTALDVVEGVDLRGKRAIVTGSSSGIGVEMARALAAADAEVTLAVRNLDAGEAVADDIHRTTGNHRLAVSSLDLSDLNSVAAFTDAWDGPLDILINNAGTIARERRLTSVGWEATLATNFLGHFSLAQGLHGALARGRRARIVTLSSTGHMRSPVVFDDMNFANRPYDPMLAYGQSKTAQILFAVEATRRWAADGITANAVDPGAIATTGLTRELQSSVRTSVESAASFSFLTTEQGAATAVFVATSPLLDGIGGRYFEDLSERPIIDTGMQLRRAGDPLPEHAVAAYAMDADNSRRLWDLAAATLRKANR